ncbi:hypothetical protein BJV78DRAFT_1198105 [Lactifluus subvellereus]|nr:hypothetical protein BJV78DRAFT_1198105 [Lactifluus subvellereus]
MTDCGGTPAGGRGYIRATVTGPGPEPRSRRKDWSRPWGGFGRWSRPGIGDTDRNGDRLGLGDTVGLGAGLGPDQGSGGVRRNFRNRFGLGRGLGTGPGLGGVLGARPLGFGAVSVSEWDSEPSPRSRAGLGPCAGLEPGAGTGVCLEPDADLGLRTGAGAGVG